jgi:hypothetical protein
MRAVYRLSASVNLFIMQIPERILQYKRDITASHPARQAVLAVAEDSTPHAHLGLVEISSEVLCLPNHLLAGATHQTPTHYAFIESVSSSHQPPSSLFLFLALVHICELHYRELWLSLAKDNVVAHRFVENEIHSFLHILFLRQSSMVKL